MEKTGNVTRLIGMVKAVQKNLFYNFSDYVKQGARREYNVRGVPKLARARSAVNFVHVPAETRGAGMLFDILHESSLLNIPDLMSETRNYCSSIKIRFFPCFSLMMPSRFSNCVVQYS